MFANLLNAVKDGVKRKDRFTLDELRRLNDVVARTTAVTTANRDALVETFREIAELMIWGDQNEPTFFDAFVEMRTLTHFSRFINQQARHRAGHRQGQPARGGSHLTLQLLQTLSIMLQNIQLETSLFYLFSNNHVNELIECDFDFDDEEVMAYYISLLKTISLKLNPATVQFFFDYGDGVRGGNKKSSDAPGAKLASFPLFTRAVGFVEHPESMVRAAARTVVLNVFGVHDKELRRYLLKPENWGLYVPRVVDRIAAAVESIDGVALVDGSSPESGISHDGERSNLIAELGDLMYHVNDLMCVPDLVDNSRAGDEDENGVASRTERELWSKFVEPTALGSLKQGECATSSMTAALFALSRLMQACTLATLANRLCEVLTKKSLGEGESSRDAFVASLNSPRLDVASAAVFAVYSIVKSRHVSEEAAEEGGLLPVQMKEAMGGDWGEDEKGELADEWIAALTEFITRRRAPLAAKQCATWVLRRIATRESLGDDRRAALDKVMADAARVFVHAAMDGPWFDAASCLITQEWASARRAVEQPSIQDDTMMSALIHARVEDDQDTSLSDGSPGAGAALVDRVREFTFTATLRPELFGAALPLDTPPLGDPGSILDAMTDTVDSDTRYEPVAVGSAAELEVKEGERVDINTDTDRSVACRVAFEPGRELHVRIEVISRVFGSCVSASAVLVSEGGRVRAVAPIAGCVAEIDAKHAKWLHVRVRSPWSQLSALAKSAYGQTGSGVGGGRMTAAQRRKLQDGHWTLAFPDAQSAERARGLVESARLRLRIASEMSLAPLLS